MDKPLYCTEVAFLIVCDVCSDYDRVYEDDLSNETPEKYFKRKGWERRYERCLCKKCLLLKEDEILRRTVPKRKKPVVVVEGSEVVASPTVVSTEE